MKRVFIVFINLMIICLIGCSNNLGKRFFRFENEERAIIDTFGEYDEDKKKGIVLINQRQNDEDRTYIYYVTEPKSLKQYESIYETNNRTEESLKEREEVCGKINNEINDEIISKIDDLYKNKNIDKIRIEAGVVRFKKPHQNHKLYYNKPGERKINKKIIYLNTYNFTRENYAKILKEYNQKALEGYNQKVLYDKDKVS